MRNRLILALVAFALTVAVLEPSALALAQHGDESRYIWRADYYSTHLLALDFATGSDQRVDPGINPLT